MWRKFVFAPIYFVLFFVLATVIGGLIVGFSTVSGMDPEAGQEAISAAAQDAGENFGRQWGNVILIGSAVLALLGTIMGWLPFTKMKKKGADA